MEKTIPDGWELLTCDCCGGEGDLYNHDDLDWNMVCGLCMQSFEEGKTRK